MTNPTAKAAQAHRLAERELRLRAIITKANALVLKLNDPVANLEFMQACRAEFDDGAGFEAAWEDACLDAGWNEEHDDYQCNLDYSAQCHRSDRIDLLSAWGR